MGNDLNSINYIIDKKTGVKYEITEEFKQIYLDILKNNKIKNV